VRAVGGDVGCCWPTAGELCLQVAPVVAQIKGKADHEAQENADQQIGRDDTDQRHDEGQELALARRPHFVHQLRAGELVDGFKIEQRFERSNDGNR
jgi:hypothetical protein